MKPYIANKKRLNRKRAIILMTVLILVLLAAIGAQAYRSRSTNQSTDNDTPAETINYGPATEEEKNQTEQHKDDITKQQEEEQNQNPTDNKIAVTPIITDASQYGDKVEVRAYVPAIVETGGKCTLAFKHGSNEITRSIDTLAGPQTTQCDTVTVPVSEFPSKGTWTLTVSYSSDASAGISAAQNVEVN